MRTFLIIATLLFPMASGIVSVITAGPATNEAVSALTYAPSTTVIATRLDR